MAHKTVSALIRRAVIFLLTLLFILNNTSFVLAASLSQNPNNLISECEHINENVLRADLYGIIQEFFLDEANFDFRETVNRQWRILKIDSTIDTEIDKAVSEVNNDAGLVNRFKSSWLPSKAEELANKVTEIAFNSEAVDRKLKQLSENMSDELTNSLELVSAESSSVALDCLQNFVKNQYSDTFVNEFGAKIENSIPDTSQSLDSFTSDTSSYMTNHKFAFGGAAFLAVTALTKQLIAKQIIDRVTQQVVARVGERLGLSALPAIGEFVGGALIAVDLIKSFDGALPQIQKSLKGEDLKQALQEEIANKISEKLRFESSQIARELSNDIYAEWLDFQKDYQSTLSLAGQLPEFKNLLDRNADLSKISLLIGISLNSMGRNELIASIEDGSLEKVLDLPKFTYKMLQTTHSLNTIAEWSDLAGNQIEAVVRLEIYKHLSPQQLDRQLLKEILSLKDPSVISLLILLDIDSIRKLLQISSHNLVELTYHLSPEELKTLAGYIGELKQPQINQLVSFFLSNDPEIIKNSAVIDSIVQSHNIETSISFWEAEKKPLSFLDGILKILSGRISWHLLAEKYGVKYITAFFILLIILAAFLLLAAWIIFKQISKKNISALF